MLSDTHVRHARPRERDYKLSDFDGLHLLARCTGSKLWRFAYRFDGKQKLIALGVYPQVTLAEARDRREAARKLLANNKDPSVERRLEKIARQAGGKSFARSLRNSSTSRSAKSAARRRCARTAGCSNLRLRRSVTGPSAKLTRFAISAAARREKVIKRMRRGSALATIRRCFRIFVRTINAPPRSSVISADC